MSNQVFVGGLSWNVDTDMLAEAFEQFGRIVDAKVIVDRETRRSRGFGFVTYETEEEASDAITGMDGKEIDGRSVRVNLAEQRTDRRTGPSGGRDQRQARW